jgi:hypothetical protein
VIAAIARVQAGAARFPVPALILHGGADRMVPADGSRRFAAAGGRARLIEYPDGYHALLADLGGDAVLNDLGGWLESRLAEQAGSVPAGLPPVGSPPAGSRPAGPSPIEPPAAGASGRPPAPDAGPAAR